MSLNLFLFVGKGDGYTCVVAASSLAPRQNIYTTRTAAKHSKPENPDRTYCMMRSTLYVVLLVIVVISRCFFTF
jgi:hypothetical protein